MHNQLFAISGQRYRAHIVITILILFVQALVVLLAQDLMVLHELLECCKINLFSFALLLHHFATKFVGSWLRRVERHWPVLGIFSALSPLLKHIAWLNLTHHGRDFVPHEICVFLVIVLALYFLGLE